VSLPGFISAATLSPFATQYQQQRLTAPAADGGKNEINSDPESGSLLDREMDHSFSVAITWPRSGYCQLALTADGGSFQPR
jgi:hypothetical protein